jgi:NADH-quinone oxidoreductase subunit M
MLMMFTNSLLSILTWGSCLGGIVALLLGHAPEHANRARIVAIITTIASLLLCIPLLTHFNSHDYTMQFQEHWNWLPSLGISYNLGVDGISLSMIVLTCFTTLLVVLAGWKSVHTKVAQYMAAFLIMQGFMIGVFAALDAILFYFFWEAMLVPMYLIIGIWGSENRFYASIKFFLYTFFGSALFLAALLYLGSQAHSFDILSFYPLHLTLFAQQLIFFAFLLAFAVKVPMWPVHTWLPDAHTEAPAGGSVVLAAIMLKMGAYGFLRFTLPILPDASQSLDWLMIGLSLIAIVYIGFVALAQVDMKKLIAYSSIAHMGFVTLGCFMIFSIVRHTHVLTNAYMSLDGAIVQMISHGFGSAALFLCVGVLYDRMHTRRISDYGGVVNSMPIFASFFMLFALSNAGLPGTSGFVGEFMVVLSAFQGNFWIAFVAASTLLLGAAYTLYMYKRVVFGESANTAVTNMPDINWIDRTVFILVAAMIIFIGVYPAPLLQLLHTSVAHLLDLSLQSKMVGFG